MEKSFCLFMLGFIFFILLINLINQIALQIAESINRCKYYNLKSEYYFYKNSSFRKTYIALIWIPIFMISLVIFLNHYKIELFSSIGDNDLLASIFESDYSNFDMYVTIVISIFTGVFVNTLFCSIINIKDIVKKDKNSLEILKIIARCYLITDKIMKNTKHNAKCYLKDNFIPNVSFKICPFSEEINNSHENICYCSKSLNNLNYCKAHDYYSRMLEILIFNIDMASSIAALNKPSMLTFLEYVKIGLLNFKIMLNQCYMLDITYLSNIIDVDAYFKCGDLSLSLRNYKPILFKDIKQINSVYKDFQREAMAYALHNFLPLEMGVILYHVTKE